MEIKTTYGIGDAVKFAYPYKSENIITAKVLGVDVHVGESGRPVVKYRVFGDCGFLFVRESHLIQL